MKKTIFVIVSLILIISFSACAADVNTNITIETLSPSGAAEPSAPLPTVPEATQVSTPALTPETALSPTPTITPDAVPSPAPTTTATSAPTSSVFAPETPDSAGSGGILFDIYANMASADLNKDGTNEELKFEAGSSGSTMYINGAAVTIGIPGLAQKFAVTDVDMSDSLLELVFTDKYNAGLADTEFPNSYLYWWNGSGLISMGSLLDVKFDGDWRSAFDAAKYFRGNGEVYSLAHTTELTDVWYMKQCKPDGADRKLKEGYNATKPVNIVAPLTIKPGKACLLLAHGESKFFENSSMWDYANYPHNLGRAISPTADINIIAQAGETLNVVAVLNPNWFKLQTADGYKGWIKVVDGVVQGYRVAPADIFSGIVNAG